MTEDVRRGVLAAAAAAARTLGGRVQVVPHPVEPARGWEEAVASVAGRATVEVANQPLLEVLPGAGLMVTGWSNSVFEAALVGVPSVTVHLIQGSRPVSFAAEGLATEVRSSREAAQVATSLARDPGRGEAVRRARAALGEHLGPLDGQAGRRSAELVLRVLG